MLSFCLNVYAAPGETEIVDPYELYSYDRMCEDINTLQSTYPELISVSVLGQSVENRDIPIVTLGKGERIIIMCASMHAREYVSTNFVMYMIDQYCRGYTDDTWYAGLSYRILLDNVRFVIVPMLNPDGVNLAQNGIENAIRREALEQMELVDTWKSGYYGWKANINGVDLNRNWPYNWAEDEDVKAPASANYNGSAPCTEPEVIAMKQLIDSTPFNMLCSFHTSGEVIYWIDTSNSIQMASKFAPIINRLAQWTGYRMLGYENVSSFGGYMVNYARGTYEKPCFTVELCPISVDYPYTDYNRFYYTVKKALPIGLIMADEVMKMEAVTDNYPDPTPEQKPSEIRVFIDGEELGFPDVKPIIENNRTLVPLRAVCEALGLEVNWKGSGLIDVIHDDITVTLNVGRKVMTVGENYVALDAAPKIIEDRTLLPIRAVLEAFGCSLEWDGEQKFVNVFSKTQNNDVVIPQ